MEDKKSLSVAYELKTDLSKALDIIKNNNEDVTIHLYVDGIVSEDEPLKGVVVHGMGKTNHKNIVINAIELGVGLIVLHSESGGIYAPPVDEFDTEFLLNQLSYADVAMSPLTCIDTNAVKLASACDIPIILTDTRDINNLEHIIHKERVGTLISKKEFGER